MKKFLLSLPAGAALVAAFAFVGPGPKPELLNMNNFHLVDFVGWNTSMTVLKHYHTDDVQVFGAGYTTSGIQAHEAALSQMIKQMPDAKIVQHFPNVAQGEWTGVVGDIAALKAKMATVAKWRNGRIAEEYLFNVQLPAAEAAALQPSAKPLASFANANDPALATEVNVQPGWSCAMDEVKGKRTAFFLKKVNGRETERLVFQ